MERLDRFFSNGILTDVSAHEVEGKLVVTKKQDIEPNIEWATQLRNSDEYSKQGIKNGWWHAAHIPNVVVLQLKKIGVDIDRASAKEILAGLRKLNMDYLITTRGQV
jgi:hypothetical protein